MRFSVTIPGLTLFPGLEGTPDWAAALRPDELQMLAARVDELGYHQIAVPWHVAVRAGEWTRNMGPRWPHALSAAGFLLGATKRVQVLTLVVAPCCNTLELAKALATLDWMSGGRAVPVLLAGYIRWEFEQLGADFDARDAVLDEQARAMTQLWRTDCASFEGEHVRFFDVVCEPKPSADLTLWFGGRGRRALRRVAEFGAGWMSYGMRHADHARALEYVRAQPTFQAAPRALEVAAYFTEPTHDPYTHEQTAPPVPTIGRAAVLQRVADLAALGVTSTGAALAARPGDGPATCLEHFVEQLEWFAAEILPAT